MTANQTFRAERDPTGEHAHADALIREPHPRAERPRRSHKEAMNREEPTSGGHRVLIWTSKGGTGKTTTVSNTGVALARLGLNVLLVGFDPQAHLEITFGIRVDAGLERLLGGGDPRELAVDIPLPHLLGEPPPGRLGVLPCSRRLNESIPILARGEYINLDRLLAAFDDQVDLVLIDTQGAFSPISHAAALAADSVLFCQEPGYFEYLELEERFIEAEKHHLSMHPLGVLFVRTDARSRQMREYRAHFENPDGFAYGPLHVFRTHIRQQVDVRDHPRRALPTVLADPKGHVAEDYRAFAGELLERLVLHAEEQS
jgi:chromosome partitioning protein